MKRRVPEEEEVLKFIEIAKRCVTRSEVASAFDISYTSSAKLLESLYEKLLVWKRVHWITPKVYRISYCPYEMLKREIESFIKEKGETTEPEIIREMETGRKIVEKALSELTLERKVWRLIKRITKTLYTVRYYPPVLYRTMLALLIYAREPDRKTPDPIRGLAPREM